MSVVHSGCGMPPGRKDYVTPAGAGDKGGKGGKGGKDCALEGRVVVMYIDNMTVVHAWL